MNNKLKPCPFCGGKVYIDNEDCYGYEHIDFFVHCDNCSLQFGFASQFETEEDAVKAWNTRKPMDSYVEQYKWESDVAISQLEQLGVRFAEKLDDEVIKEVNHIITNSRVRQVE